MEMENSFFEYRDKTGVVSGSDSEYIDDSIVEDVTKSTKKNRTVFVAESDDPTSEEETLEEEGNNTPNKMSKSVDRHSSYEEMHVTASSGDDGSRRGSIKRPSDSQNNMVVTSSDDEEELSPELVPKRRPLPRPKSMDSDKSLIIRKTKKRMIFLDSDTDNSIIMEHNKNTKHACIKDTPLKVDGNNSKQTSDVNQSMDYDEVWSEGEDTQDNNGDEESFDGDGKVGDGDNDSDDSLVIKKSSKAIEKNVDLDETADEVIPAKEMKNTDSKKKNELQNDHDYISKPMNEDDSDLSKTDDHNDDNSHVQNDNDDLSKNDAQNGDNHSDIGNYDSDNDDEGPDEDLMVMSRATRMSIMGVIPKDDDDDSDESDFLQSDESSRKSRESLVDLPEVSIHDTPENTIGSRKDIAGSLDDLPEISMHSSPEEPTQNSPENKLGSRESISGSLEDLPEVTIQNTPDKSIDLDDSRISCSPFASPLQNITNDLDVSRKKYNKNNKVIDFIDLSINVPNKITQKTIDLSNVGAKRVQNFDMVKNEPWPKNEFDDDVKIIDTKTEIIALSSDDEDDVKIEKSPKIKKSPKPKDDPPQKGKENSIKSYMVPPSYPNQVVYVKKHVRENELNKLHRLQEDLNNVRQLLEEMDMETLPDGGSKLIERLSALEADTRRQGDKVANMVVEPDVPTAADLAMDGFDKGLSWADIQKASNAVQPRMFGKQAMATHMAERNLILERLRDLHQSLESRPSDTTLATAPRLMKSSLMPHQLHALAWLKWRETQRPSAGILADDMGLGKTITMIALVASDKQDKIDHDDDDEDEGTGRGKMIRGGALVVCPASLIQQWGGEVSKHCAAHALSVCLHHGAARAEQPHRLATYDIVATTYNILQRDCEKNGVLMKIQWRRIILDEAHIVRNHKSATSNAVCSLKGKRRWCLTGTPVQNKDLDLFALLKFLRCSPFDDLQMWKKWIDNKSLGGQERLSTIMRCVLLRRTKVQLQQKGQLACLPARTPHQLPVTLTQQEMNVYQKVLVLSKTLFAQFLHQRAEKNAESTGFAAPGKNCEYAKMHKRMVALQGVKPVKSHEILVLLLRLRQVCCHCGLIAAMLDEEAAGAPEEAASSDLLRELDKLSLEDQSRRKSNNPEEDADDGQPEESATADEAIRAVLSPNNPVFQLKRPSSKITAVMECLNNNVFTNKGDKAVVVSQWTSVLRLVEEELNKQKIRSVTLSGVVPVPQRPRLIQDINDPNSNVKVMLLSLCAGGVGINLCGANHLLLLDPHWNPQLEEQAQDRIYRVGQKKDVHIYRFMCVDTVEQTIRKLQEAKLQLAENVLTGARNNKASTLSIEDLKMLFNMGPSGA